MSESEKVESLYCDKCFESVNFFLDEAQANSTTAQRYKELYKDYKLNFTQYKNKFEALEFEFDEMKSLKDHYEELISQASPLATTAANVNSKKERLLVPFDLTLINHESSETITESETSITLNLDLSYLKNQNSKFFRVDNLEKLFAQFAQAFAKTCVTPMSDRARAIEYTNKLVESLPKNCKCVLNVDAKSATINTHTEHFPADHQNEATKIKGNFFYFNTV
jgi:hypothetical protein